VGEFVKVVKKSELPPDTGKYIEVRGKEIALFKVQDKIYALDHICPHAGGPLAEGGLNNRIVTCPWHGWDFDVTTGQCSFNPAVKIVTYKVREDGEDISVEV